MLLRYMLMGLLPNVVIVFNTPDSRTISLDAPLSRLITMEAPSSRLVTLE